jgi:general stress protein 26
MSLVNDHMDTPNPPHETIPAERVWEMLAAIDIAMLVTRSGDGLQGRPMSTIPKREKGVIYILTEADSSAAREIRADGSVFLSYQGRGDHIALQGNATVTPDRALVKELWNPGAEMFWPNGPEAHDVVALVIDPGHADVWDGPGLLRGIASVLKSVVRKQTPDMGTQGSVDL